MNTELLKETIKRELPGLLRDDPTLRAYILDLTPVSYTHLDVYKRQGRIIDAVSLLIIDPSLA